MPFTSWKNGFTCWKNGVLILGPQDHMDAGILSGKFEILPCPLLSWSGMRWKTMLTIIGLKSKSEVAW